MDVNRLVNVLAKVNGGVAVALFLGLTVVVTLQVFTRFVLHSPFLWSEEVARFLFFWTVLMGAALSVFHKRHFVIDVLPPPDDSLAKSPLKKIWHLIPDLTVAGFCLFLLISGIGYTEVGTFRTGTNSRVNMAYVYAAIPTFAGLSLIYTLTRMVNFWRTPVDTVLVHAASPED